MSERIIHATVANFDELVKKDGLCLVDFWANWCGPCKMLAPVIEQYVGENKDITVLKGRRRRGRSPCKTLRHYVDSDAYPF